MQIPMSSPDIGDRERALIQQVLLSRDLSLGPRLAEFEGRMAAFLGARHAVGVSSGTAGLHLCVRAAGMGEGDEVITTPFSFIASANCLLYERATPVFVDIDPLTLNIDPDRIEEKITPRTKALLPVHIFGQPCQMDRIMDIAQRHGLLVIEDACEAIGSRFRDKPVGTFGQAAVFAFYPNKQMTTGEGGMVVTSRDDWAPLFRSLRNQGREDNDHWLQHVRLGYNYRLDELSAALGIAQLERIQELLAKRDRVASMYNLRLAGCEGLHLPCVAPDTTTMSWFLYVVQLDSSLDRQRIIALLAEHGIPSRTYFPPIHLQPFYVERFGYRQGDFPFAEQIAQRTLALPFSSVMTEEEVEHVCTCLRRILARERSDAIAR